MREQEFLIGKQALLGLFNGIQIIFVTAIYSNKGDSTL